VASTRKRTRDVRLSTFTGLKDTKPHPPRVDDFGSSSPPAARPISERWRSGQPARS
jgi:hypothetical protein